MSEQKGKGKRKKYLKRVVIIGIILLVGGLGYGYYYTSANIYQVDGAVVGRDTIQEVVEETGVIAAASVSTVSAKTNFDIEKVYYQVGDYVKKGNVLLKNDVQSSSAEISSLQAQISGIQAQLDLAVQNSEQLRILYENDAISKQDYDSAVVQEQELRAQISSLEYSIQSLRDNVVSNRVEAPMSGIITEWYVSEGDTAIMGSNLVEISDMESVYLKANLMAEDAGKIEIGDQVVFLDYSDLSGTVKKISPKVKEELSDLGIVQKRVEVHIEVENVTNNLLGESFDIKIIVEEAKEAISIPKKAVFSINEKDYVYVVDSGQAEQKEVIVGLKGATYYEIKEGLSEGEVVIISPSEDIKNGSRVELAEEKND